MAAAEPALFRAFPGLRRRLPHRPWLSGPTPVEPLPLPGIREGLLWIKRDEASCPLYGGNKPRKLEFLLAAALARGSRRLVTTGGLGTHHGLATTILGRDAGLETSLVLVRQAITPQVRQNLLRLAAWGARLHYGGNVPGAAAQIARVLAGSTLRGERPTWIPAGGSSRRGNLGFVSAGLELGEQIRHGLLPEPAEVYVAVGSGGTLAGLLAGFALAGLRSRAVGVLVSDILPPTHRSVGRAARSALAWLRRLDPAVPAPPLPAFDLVGEQLGECYGAPTEAGREAVARAASLGLRLETTYTGKCLAEICARAARGSLPEQTALFWNTYNGVDPDLRAPGRPGPEALPARLRRFLEGGETAPQSSRGPTPAK